MKDIVLKNLGVVWLFDVDNLHKYWWPLDLAAVEANFPLI